LRLRSLAKGECLRVVVRNVFYLDGRRAYFDYAITPVNHIPLGRDEDVVPMQQKHLSLAGPLRRVAGETKVDGGRRRRRRGSGIDLRLAYGRDRFGYLRGSRKLGKDISPMAGVLE